MTMTYAYMNYGRWLHNCTECGTALPVDKDICPVCYPDVVAIAYQPGNDGLFRPVPDDKKRQQGRARAAAADRLYQPEFPQERAQIERILRMRKRQNMNWEPGESVDLLIADNIKHGDGLPKELQHGL